MTTFIGEDNQTAVSVEDIGQLQAAASNSETIHDLAMLEVSPVVVLRWTLPNSFHPKFTYISSNVHQLGYSAEELLSGKLNWFDFIHPDDAQDVFETIKLASLEGKEYYTQTYRIKDPSGNYRWVENRGNIVRAEDGRIRYYQGLIIDISDRKAIEDQLSQQTASLEILHKTALGLMQRLDSKSLFSSLVKRLADLVNADFASLNLVDTTKNYIEIVAVIGLDSSIIGSTSVMGEGLFGTVWKTKEAIYVENYQTWYKRLKSPNPTFGAVRSVACLPLCNNGNVTAVMGFGTKKIIKFDPNTRKILESFAQIASVTIENAKLFENAQKELQERQKLENTLALERNALAKQTQFRTELANLIAHSLSGELTGDFYQTILERAIAIIPGAEAGSLLAKGNSEKYYFKAAAGYDLNTLAKVNFKENELFRNINDPEPLRIFDIDARQLDEQQLSKTKELSLAAKQNFQVSLTIPIHLFGKPLALFSLDNFHNRDAFDDDTLYLAKIFANQVTALWQRFLLEKNLKKNQNNYRQLFLESSQYSKELKILDKIRSIIATKLELNELLDTVCKSIVDIFGYGRVSVGMVKDNYIVTVASHGTDESIRMPDKSPLSNQSFQTIQKNKKPYFLPKDSTVFKEDSHSKTVMILPLISQSEIKGLIAIGCDSRNIGNSEQALIEKIAEQLQIAIDNITLNSKVKEDLVRTQALYDVSRAMQDHNDYDGFMDSIIWSIREAINSDWAVIYKMNFALGSVDHVSKANLASLSPIETLNFEQLNSGLAGWAIRHQEPAYTLNILEDARENNCGNNNENLIVNQTSKSLNISSAIVIPLIYQNEIFGTLATFNQQTSPDFSPEDLDLLTSVAEQASVALAQYELRKAIEYQAFHDTLTGLPNRIYIENSLNAAIKEAKEQKRYFATMFLDLDGFKNVNDTLGHDIGDELLKAVSGRLSSNTLKENTLARMGGDEFAVVIQNLAENDKSKAKSIAESYLNLLQRPFQIGKHTLKVGASIGISFYPDDGKDLSTLLKHADSAMYQAKYSGKNSVCLFTPEIATKIKDRMEMENDLRQVIEDGGLELHYQPQICLHQNKRVGVEALLRWNHPIKGFISPDDFIPISEESKLILDIGKWVIEEACRQNAAWQAEGFEALTMAVNISALQFESNDFMEIVASALEHSGLAPEYLELEVTESVIMQDVDMVIDRLNALRSIGVKVSIDDFGTGYSSLQYLQKLPLDKLKIDKAFVDEISTNDTPIITSIFILAQSLGLTTVAEGVETQEQLDFVRMLGCNEVQGYYFSKSVPASDIWKSRISFKNPTIAELTATKEQLKPNRTDLDMLNKEAA